MNLALDTRIMNSVRDNRVMSPEKQEKYLLLLKDPYLADVIKIVVTRKCKEEREM